MDHDFGCGHYVLDDDGEPRRLDNIIEWGEWFSTHDRHLGDTTVCDRYRVSTVFLGLDHNFSGEHESLPRLWETMIFETRAKTSVRIEIPADEPWKPPHVLEERGFHESVGDQWRYTSKAQALKGHARAVAIAERWCQESDAKAARNQRNHGG
jgi:hypothetical protein